MRIKLHSCSDVSIIPEYRFDKEGGYPMLVIRHNVIIEPRDRDEMGSLRSWASQIILESITYFAMIDDIDKLLDELGKTECAFGRCFSFTDIVAGTENLLGKSPKRTYDEWVCGFETKELELLRDISFFEIKSKKVISKPIHEKFEANNDSSPPPELLDPDFVKHSDMLVSSLIDMSLWDKAGWTGVGYIFGGCDLPVVFLLFRNKNVAIEIFKQWRQLLGSRDEKDLLRLSIINGVKRSHPSHYNVIVGSNPRTSELDKVKCIGMVFRIHCMEPSDTSNQDMFFYQYSRVGRYLLMPAYFVDGMSQPEVFDAYSIEKKELRRVEAWRVGRNDPDSCAIRCGDDLIIPDGEQNPPVQSVLDRFK